MQRSQPFNTFNILRELNQMIYGPYLDQEIEITYDCDRIGRGSGLLRCRHKNKKGEKPDPKIAIFRKKTLWQEK